MTNTVCSQKLFNFSESQFPHMNNGDTNIYPHGIVWVIK